MKQPLKSPCNECPFLNKMKRGFTLQRLTELALIPNFHCHKTGDCKEDEEGLGEFVANEKSVLCAGAMIFLAKRKHRFTYGFDESGLNMDSDVR